jgi:hypothetical protein
MKKSKIDLGLSNQLDFMEYIVSSCIKKGDRVESASVREEIVVSWLKSHFGKKEHWFSLTPWYTRKDIAIVLHESGILKDYLINDICESPFLSRFLKMHFGFGCGFNEKLCKDGIIRYRLE